MMETMSWNGELLAFVIRGSAAPDQTSFLTPRDVELQVGFVVYGKGGHIAPHRHVPITRQIERTCEVIVVREGRCEVDIYNDDRERVGTFLLNSGDLIMMISGGHGFRMLEDTILLEVKQGPYYGTDEKEKL